MKLEKRDVYVKEFWSMSYRDRYIYAIVNMLTIGIKLEINPLKWSILSLYFAFVTAIAVAILPIYCLHLAYKLKTEPMPDCNDPMFKGADDWYVSDKWVVKQCNLNKKENKQ